MRYLRLIIFSLILGVYFVPQPLNSEVLVDPMGVAVVFGEDEVDPQERIISLFNEGDEAVSFEVHFSSPDREELQAVHLREGGPLRGINRDERGEPDEGGYEWRDSDENDGPEYEWIDIAEEFEEIQNLNFGDDTNIGPLALGFEMPFYDNVYEVIRVCSNGWASYTNALNTWWFAGWQEMPNQGIPIENLLAVAFTDWNPARGGGTYRYAATEEMAVADWTNIPHIDGDGSWTFQLILYPNGFIKYQFLNTEARINRGVLFGYQNADRDLGAEIFRGSGWPPSEFAIGVGTAPMFLSWLSADPEIGEIEAGGDVDIALMFDPTDLEDGVYDFNVEFEFSDPAQPLIVMSAVMSVRSPVSVLSGNIFDAAGEDEPVQGVKVAMDYYRIDRFTDGDGAYEFENLPMGEYEFTITAPDFLRQSHMVEIDEEEEELDIQLLHSRCIPDPEAIVREIGPDFSIDLTLDVHNAGNGPLTYTVDRRLIGDANADPWVLRNSLYVGEEVDDTYIMGAIFDGVNFYVSGSNDNSPVIYIFDREGNLQDSFDQPGDDRRGLRDLAWDGNLIWGADSDNIYGFNRAGEVQYTLDAPFSPTSNVTWDPIHQWLWVSTTTTNIIALDLNGDQQAVVDRQGLRVYGLGFYADDPDGYNLYIFAKEPDTDRPYIHKANTDEDEVMFVEYLDTDIGISPSGIFITNQYDIYSYVMVATMNAPGNIGGDRIDIWQVDARKSWMQIDPAEGVIDAGATTEFDVVLDATGLPPEIFEGEFVFTHDGVGGETHVPVTLNVVEGPVEAELTLEFEQGWNMVSVYLQPDPEDVVALMQPLVDEDLLLLMKNGSGNFYSPADDFNNIPGWFVDEGYLMKVTQSCELTLAGETVVQDEPIDLLQGWQMISCYLRDSVDAIVALSGIVDNLVIAKDGWGNFYKPDWEFSNMGDMIWGRGYMVKMTEDTQLIYRLFLEDDELDHVQQRSVYASPGRLGVHPLTGANMSLALIAGSGFEAPVGETEIGVYASGELVGSGILQGGRCGIAIWGDDPSTPVVDGAVAGEALEIRVLDTNGLRVAECVTLAGSPSYKTDSFWAVELTGTETVPTEFGIVAVYPNPFNNRTQVSYGLSVAGHVELSLYDLEGRLVQVLASGEKPAGMHTFAIDGASLSSGVYIVQLRSQGEVSRWKVAMMK